MIYLTTRANLSIEHIVNTKSFVWFFFCFLFFVLFLLIVVFSASMVRQSFNAQNNTWQFFGQLRDCVFKIYFFLCVQFACGFGFVFCFVCIEFFFFGCDFSMVVRVIFAFVFHKDKHVNKSLVCFKQFYYKHTHTKCNKPCVCVFLFQAVPKKSKKKNKINK